MFIHKETDEEGKTTYHIVDGKQRLQTILMFKNNEVSIDKDFGDINLNGKKFEELTMDQKMKFWDYVIVVDFVDLPNSDLINQVFDRLNRNSKNLNEQELRHAKYNGWFITEVEKEIENSFWETVKISTKARARRMKDVQFVSELFMILIEGKIVGFSQDHINDVYAKYENSTDIDSDFEEESFLKEKERVRKSLEKMETEGKSVVTKWATTFNNFYTLWALIALIKEGLMDPKDLAKKYGVFMNKISSMTDETQPEGLSDESKLAYAYFLNSRGASTDLKQRTERLESLKKAILDHENT